MTLQQLLESALPVVAALIMSFIQQDTWPNWVNALIAIAVLALGGFVVTWLGSGLTGRPDADIAVIVAATLALQATPSFQPYFAYIQSNFFVVAPRPKAPPSPVAPALTVIEGGKQADPTTPAS